MTMKAMSISFFTNSLSCSAQNYSFFTLYLKGEKNIFEREKNNCVTTILYHCSRNISTSVYTNV